MKNLDTKNEEENKINLNPLGLDEMNNVIKSFQNSSFNQEELFKKEEKIFVKKSLFDLAKESQDRDKQNSNNQVSVDQNLESENKKKIHNNEQNKDKNLSDLNTNQFEEKKLNENNDREENENLKSNISDSDSEKKLEDQKKDTNNALSDDEKNEEVLLTETKSNKDIDDFEEKTLDALDSVREAVSKSLENKDELEGNSNINELKGSLNKEDESYNDDKNQNVIKEPEIKQNEDQEQIKFKDIYHETEQLFKDIKNFSLEIIEENLKNKIVELSSELAGYQIDKLPEKFLDKIKKICSNFKIDEEIIVELNKIDFDTVNKFLKKNKDDYTISFKQNDELKRGDFSIKSSGILHSIKYFNHNPQNRK